MPAPVHRAALRFAHLLRKLWYRVARPRIAGCRIIAMDEAGRVLLVRQTYGTGAWFPPGGGVGRRESPTQAAVRELREEAGCALIGPVEVALSEERFHGARNRVHVIAGTASGSPVADGREVLEAGFFALERLPWPMPDSIRRGLSVWVRAAKAAGHPVDVRKPSPPPAPTG